MQEDFFHSIDSEAKAYFLGLIFTDGSISHNGLNISSNDYVILDKFCKALETPRPIYRNGEGFSVTIRNRQLVAGVKRWGVIERKSWKELYLPPISKGLMPHFLRGVIDGDGSWYVDRRKLYHYLCLSITSGSHAFLDDINHWLKSRLKIVPRKIVEYRRQNAHHSFQLRVGRRTDVEKLYSTLYRQATVFMKRKRNIAAKFYGELNA